MTIKLETYLNGLAFTSAAQTSTARFPHLIHFLPDCTSSLATWQANNPMFELMEWSAADMDSLKTSTPELADVPTTTRDETLLLRVLLLMHHYGGIIVAAPYDPIGRMDAFLEKLAGIGLILFGELEAVDQSLFIAEKTSQAVRNMVRDLKDTPTLNIRTMINSIAQSSPPGTVKTFPTAIISALMERGLTSYAFMFSTGLGDIVSGKTILEIDPENDLWFRQNITAVAISEGCISSATGPFGVLVLELAEFDGKAPDVSAAFTFAQTYINTTHATAAEGAVIIIDESPSATSGLDMFIAPYLTKLGALELHRSTFVVWKLPDPAPA